MTFSPPHQLCLLSSYSGAVGSVNLPPTPHHSVCLRVLSFPDSCLSVPTRCSGVHPQAAGRGAEAVGDSPAAAAAGAGLTTGNGGTLMCCCCLPHPHPTPSICAVCPPIPTACTIVAAAQSRLSTCLLQSLGATPGPDLFIFRAGVLSLPIPAA